MCDIFFFSDVFYPWSCSVRIHCHHQSHSVQSYKRHSRRQGNIATGKRFHLVPSTLQSRDQPEPFHPRGQQIGLPCNRLQMERDKMERKPNGYNVQLPTLCHSTKFLINFWHIFDNFLMASTEKSNCKNCRRRTCQLSERERGAWQIRPGLDTNIT